jgi:hypothetical protein
MGQLHNCALWVKTYLNNSLTDGSSIAFASKKLIHQFHTPRVVWSYLADQIIFHVQAFARACQRVAVANQLCGYL